jgi:hypothetical protein
VLGTRVGRWLVTEEIGDGGHAFVFKGVASDEVAAIKMLKPSVAGEDNLEKRFKIEADALRALSHPNIVGFRDYIYANRYHYLVMEYMDAGSVETVLRRSGPIEPRYAIPILVKVLKGLTYAHSFGYIHRDIKPNNILLSRSGEAKVTDFGIAKVIGGENLTRQGFVLGTTPYMAPEYLSQGIVTPQTDIYAMGVTLFEMLTNRKPFEERGDGEGLVDFAKRVCFGEPTPPSAYRPVPAELERIILKAIARDPKKRYRSSDRFEADLARAFPDLVDRSIEIPDGRPTTRALSAEELRSRHAELDAVRERRRRRGQTAVLAAALATGIVAALVAVLGLGLGPAPSAGAAVLAAGAVLFLASLRARLLRARGSGARLPGPEAEGALPASGEAPDHVPFHGGELRSPVAAETDVSELQAFLVVTVGAVPGKRYGLRPVSRIGRDLRFDIRPQDPEISRHHAVLTFHGADFTIQDVGSTNGTFVNEEKVIAERELRDGDLVRVGRTTMRFEYRGSGRAGPETAPGA